MTGDEKKRPKRELESKTFARKLRRLDKRRAFDDNNETAARLAEERRAPSVGETTKKNESFEKLKNV